jgi:hypothetical protein
MPGDCRLKIKIDFVKKKKKTGSFKACFLNSKNTQAPLTFEKYILE